MSLETIILAAGKGTRMKSDLPKVLHPVSGKSMIEHVLDVADQAGVDKHCVVAGFKKDLVIESLSDRNNVTYAIQKEQNGTASAVLCAKDAICDMDSTLLILCGDTPLLKSETIKKFVDIYKDGEAGIIVLSCDFEDSNGYGRIVRKDGKFVKIQEDKDCSDQEKKIKEINTGIYLGKASIVFEALNLVQNNNAQKEYYLTDILTIAQDKGYRVESIAMGQEDEFLGVNSKDQLEVAEKVLSERNN
ncbi:MAG: NTP transferase domain-containing protein [Candidatus Cloacimonetes bacterium]|nr:NTP transferase domain-containing protein [Candidatus Cloacimonadota bacterium]